MFRIDTTGKAGSKPAYTANGGAGFFQNGTTVSSEWLQHVQEELAQLLEAAGVTLSKAADNQLLGVLKGAFALVAAATDTGVVSTIWKTALIAAQNSQASGVRAAVMAAINSVVSGTNAAAVASSSADVAGTSSFAAASDDVAVDGDGSASIASASSDVDGDQSANLASVGSHAPGTQCVNLASYGASAQALRGANLASSGCTAGSTVASKETANVAANGCVTRGERVATLASYNATVGHATTGTLDSFMAGCSGGSVEENESGILASNGCAIPLAANPNTLILASNNLNAATATAPQYSVNGGDGVHGWRLGGASGNVTCTGSVSGGGLDFAEMWENDEKGEIPPGVYVTLADEDRVDVAGEGSHPLGIVSTSPTIIGGADDLAWKGATARDEWGRPIVVDVPSIAWSGWDGPERLAPPLENRPAAVESYVGKTTVGKGKKASMVEEPWLRWDAYKGPVADAPDGAPKTAHTWTAQVVQTSPDYDAKKKHTPRRARPAEFTVVGHIGRLRLRITEDAKPGDRLEPTKAGHGRPTEAAGHTRLLKVLTPYSAKRGYGIGLVFFRTPDFY